MKKKSRIEHARLLRQNATTAESLLWNALRARRLCGLKFRRQHPIGGFFVDFACVEHRLVVEVDGEYHDDQIVADRQRENFLRARGWRIIRFGNDDVRDDVDGACQAIAKFLRIETTHRARRHIRSGMMSENAPEVPKHS